MQLFLFPLSKFVNGAKIENCTTFLGLIRWGASIVAWYLKGGARLTAERVSSILFLYKKK